MNKLCRLAFLLLVTFLTFPVQAATNDTSGPDDLYFDNGDFLRGTFESIDPNTGIRWRRSDAPQAFNFGLTNVSRVVFAKNPMRADDNPAFPCRVRLTNQDTIEGDLVSCDGDTLFVNTWYAGKLAVPRKHVESVAMIPARESAVFEGPSGMEGWTSGKISVAVPD